MSYLISQPRSSMMQSMMSWSYLAGKKARDLQNWLTVYGYWNQVSCASVLPYALALGWQSMVLTPVLLLHLQPSHQARHMIPCAPRTSTRVQPLKLADLVNAPPYHSAARSTHCAGRTQTALQNGAANSVCWGAGWPAERDHHAAIPGGQVLPPPQPQCWASCRDSCHRYAAQGGGGA